MQRYVDIKKFVFWHLLTAIHDKLLSFVLARMLYLRVTIAELDLITKKKCLWLIL